MKTNKGGRPKKYTQEFLKKEAELLLKWFNDDPERFWLKDFALERGYSPQRLVEFADKSEEFSEAYARAKDIQESRLVHGAMEQLVEGNKVYTKLNPRMVMFALKNVAGWREHQDLTVGGAEDRAPITINVIGANGKPIKANVC